MMGSSRFSWERNFGSRWWIVARIPARAADVTELIDDAIEISRSLTAELSPPILRQGGLISALEWLARWMRRKYELEVHLTAREKLEPMSEDVVVLLFHATRELLFNVVKHAGVKEASIHLKRLADGIQLTVEDKGVGFDPSQLRSEGGSTGGLGLFSIRERLALLGGSIETSSSPGRGSRIKLVATRLADAAKGDRPAPEGQAKVSAAISAPSKAEQDEGEKIIRVLLVDDHVVMRQGLSGLLRAEPGIEIAGEASDGESAVALARELRPERHAHGYQYAGDGWPAGHTDYSPATARDSHHRFVPIPGE